MRSNHTKKIQKYSQLLSLTPLKVSDGIYLQN